MACDDVCKPPCGRGHEGKVPKAPSNRASQDGNRLFFIHLRQKEKRNDPRTDPKYERGNFGTTGCHGANLMAPHRIEDRLKPGDRIAFLQGGMSRDPSVSTIKIAFLTPPLSTVRPVIINCEDREVERGVIEWEPQWDHMRKRPLRFRYQLDLLDRPAELEFTPAERMMLACINDTILTAKRRKKAARISSCMRSLCRGIPIDSKNARTVIDRYEEHVKEMSSRYSSNAFVRCDSEAHTDTTAMLLRVGIDTGTDGALAPIFEDGSFEYIPISESDPSSCETRTFKNTIGRSGHPLSTYLPKKIETRTIHFDPEFDTLTYGDPTVKSRYLRSLVRGDLLVSMQV